MSALGQGARAAPDGYTILVVPPNFVVNPALYNKVPYDPYKDFDPVTIAVTIALLHREIVKTIALPGMKERMATLGYEPVGNTLRKDLSSATGRR
jgi:hypothetical protein